MKLSQIYSILGLEFSGDDIEIVSLSSLALAQRAQMSYCDSPKNTKYLADCKAGAVLVSKDMVDMVKSRAVVVENPHLAFAILSAKLAIPCSIFPCIVTSISLFSILQMPFDMMPMCMMLLVQFK